MTLEVKPSSPSRPPATPAKIDLRPAKPTSTSNSPRGQHDQHVQLQLQQQTQQLQQQLQLQQPQLLPVARSPTTRGDDSPLSALSLSLSLTRRDMDQLRQQQQQHQQQQLQQADARDSNGPRDAHHPRPKKLLPAGCKIVKMVGEGAANAVFEFTLPNGGYLKHQNTRNYPPFPLAPHVEVRHTNVP